MSDELNRIADALERIADVIDPPDRDADTYRRQSIWEELAGVVMFKLNRPVLRGDKTCRVFDTSQGVAMHTTRAHS